MNRVPLTEERVVALLERASELVEFPPTPAMAGSVRTRIEGEARGKRTAGRWFGLARPVAVAAVSLLAVAICVAVFPGARGAVADLLGVVGIEITFDGGDPQDVPRPELSELDLGTRVTIDEAASAVGFDLRGFRAVGGPARVYLDPSVGDSGMVSTVFQGPRGVSFLVTEFKASFDRAFVKKLAAPGGNVRVIRLDGAEAYWVGGAPHVFAYIDADGRVREESIRLAGNVLLWDAGGITYRIEGARSLAQARALAERMGF